VISFVVPAYNEERFLAPTLAAIHAAAAEAGERYEIVVANDNSADATAAVAAAGGARVVTVEKRQIAATRNAGARASTGDMLIVVDADTPVNGPVVAEAVAALRAGAVGGGAPVRLDRAPPWLAMFMRLLIPVFRIFRWAAGCFVFCTRDAFEKAGGFDERYFASEEIHFSQALKRHGRFVILRTMVTSSARKLDSHGFWAFLWLCVRLGIRGRSVVQRREGGIAEFWYPDKR
jgi:glycosyltransferase involved in cell wall biosynthesis